MTDGTGTPNDFVHVGVGVLIQHEGGYAMWGPLGVAVVPLQELWQCSSSMAEKRYAELSHSRLSIEIDLSASVSELRRRCFEALSMPLAQCEELGLWFCVGNANGLAELELTEFDFAGTNVRTLFDALDFEGDLFAFCCVSDNAGEVFRGVDKDLRYHIRPKERARHRVPHIHVYYKHEQSCSIAIGTGLVLGGHIPGRALKVARERILSNKDLLMHCWENGALGIYHDLNVCLGSASVSGL